MLTTCMFVYNVNEAASMLQNILFLTRWRRFDFAITCLSHRPQPSIGSIVFNRLICPDFKIFIHDIQCTPLYYDIDGTPDGELVVVDCGTDYIEVSWGMLYTEIYTLSIDPMPEMGLVIDRQDDIRIARFMGLSPGKYYTITLTYGGDMTMVNVTAYTGTCRPINLYIDAQVSSELPYYCSDELI